MGQIFGADAEWLEADGLGGFASGAVSGVRSRRYHALLLAARTPPTDRFVLVNGVEAWFKAPSVDAFPLTAHRYVPGVVHPQGFRWLESFTPTPWPTWIFRLDGRIRVQHEVVVPRGASLVLLAWRLLREADSGTLTVRPLLSVREYHHLHRENPAFDFRPEVAEQRLTWRPYWGVPEVTAQFSGTYTHAPEWYRSFLYEEERRRGLDHVEDLASPGEFAFELSGACPEAILAFSTGAHTIAEGADLGEWASGVRESERARRAALGAGLTRAADAYIVKRGLNVTIVAGYPWFTDWGRDTFLAMRGLCLSTGRLDDARRILVEWSRAQVGGLLPNRFPDEGAQPEFNSVDAALWFVQAAHDFLVAARDAGLALPAGEEKLIRRTCLRVIEAYMQGAGQGIRMDVDGLLSCGERNSSLTWMDARVQGRAITPRVGKPVEVQALWINAVRLCASDRAELAAVAARASSSFLQRFWDGDRGHLADVVDADHQKGAIDPSLRPNQLLAIGGLRHQVLSGEPARRVVELCERELLTPMGLRTLSAHDSSYRGVYSGDAVYRDEAYHNGTAWPWLLGPFVEAWVRVRGARDPRSLAGARSEALERFVNPLLSNPRAGGLGHIAEIADGDPPHAPRGCPFQAWSVGEVLRLRHTVLGGA